MAEQDPAGYGIGTTTVSGFHVDPADPGRHGGAIGNAGERGVFNLGRRSRPVESHALGLARGNPDGNRAEIVVRCHAHGTGFDRGAVQHLGEDVVCVDAMVIGGSDCIARGFHRANFRGV